MISGIVLAAGSARRMGRQKLLLDLGGKPVLQWTLEAVLASKLDEIVCVVREAEETPPRIPLKSERLRWIVNEKAHEGQSTSLIAGLKAIDPESEAAVFLVGDQPLVRPDLIDGLIDLFLNSRALIAAAAFKGEIRNPVLFHRDLFPEILTLTGDRGARNLIEKYRAETVFLAWHDDAPFLDLDSPQDYEEIKRRKETGKMGKFAS